MNLIGKVSCSCSELLFALLPNQGVVSLNNLSRLAADNGKEPKCVQFAFFLSSMSNVLWNISFCFVIIFYFVNNFVFSSFGHLSKAFLSCFSYYRCLNRILYWTLNYYSIFSFVFFTLFWLLYDNFDYFTISWSY